MKAINNFCNLDNCIKPDDGGDECHDVVDEEVEVQLEILDWRPPPVRGVFGVAHLVFQRSKSLGEIRAKLIAAF